MRSIMIDYEPSKRDIYSKKHNLVEKNMSLRRKIANI
jgi:hypothetical protein